MHIIPDKKGLVFATNDGQAPVAVDIRRLDKANLHKLVDLICGECDRRLVKELANG